MRTHPRPYDIELTEIHLVNHGVSLRGLESSRLRRPRICAPKTMKSFTGQSLTLRLYFIVTDITRLMSDGYGWVNLSVESRKTNNMGKKESRSLDYMTGRRHMKMERIPAKLGGLYSRFFFSSSPNVLLLYYCTSFFGQF